MELQQFIKDFEAQFAEIESGTIKPDSDYKNVDGWDSMTAMLVIDMVNEKYGKTLVANDFASCKTVADLFTKIKG